MNNIYKDSSKYRTLVLRRSIFNHHSPLLNPQQLSKHYSDKLVPVRTCKIKCEDMVLCLAIAHQNCSMYILNFLDVSNN